MEQGRSGAAIRLAADIGGTFTDVAALEPRTGRLSFGKALSTPARLVDGIGTGAAKAGTGFAEAQVFLHGSTVAINTMLERTGARTALVTTEGFRDIYEIGRINRPDAYNLFFRKHVPLIPRSLRFEVRERMTAEGEVHVPLDEAGLHELCDRLAELRIEAVAIMLLHAYRNPTHELRAEEILRDRLPGAFISASHTLSQEYREFERCSTVAANAYVGPRVRDYVASIDSHLKASAFRGPFLLVQSTGGLYEAAQAQAECIRMLESGPAAGVIGAQALCAQLGLPDAIAFDMGGTTAKAGVIHRGEALTRSNALVGGYAEALPVQIPLIDIFEVGTGGGSIAGLDEGGGLFVGPRSAGAAPGPACYGLGGTLPTVTDANLLLGRLDGASFLGGEMRLDHRAAAAAMEEYVARPLGLTVTEAAEGIIRIVTTAMSFAVKGVSTERGLDAAAFALIGYGGAGPLHAAGVAREIGMQRLIVPRAPGHFCAFGMLFADLRYDHVRTRLMRLVDAGFDDLESVYAEMEAEGRAALARSGLVPEAVRVSRAADMRYVGQEHAVTIDLPFALFAAQDRAGIKRAFDADHLMRYGTSAPGEPAEIVSLRSTVSGVMAKPRLDPIDRGTEEPPARARRGTRPVIFPEVGAVPTRVFDRSALLAGNRLRGPSLVEEHASTTVLHPGDVLEVDALGNLVIHIAEAQR
jgi:N-methylhydantoinase A